VLNMLDVKSISKYLLLLSVTIYTIKLLIMLNNLDV